MKNKQSLIIIILLLIVLMVTVFLFIIKRLSPDKVDKVKLINSELSTYQTAASLMLVEYIEKSTINIEKYIKIDFWGNNLIIEYFVKNNNLNIIIISMGEDKKFNTNDDISFYESYQLSDYKK